MLAIKWSDLKEERIDPEFGAARGPVVRASIIEDHQAVNCKNIVPGWSVYNARWER